MAAKKTPTDKVKATVWTPDMRMDFESNRIGGVVLLFKSLNTQELRSKALALCHEADAEMTARAMAEAAKDAGG